MNKPVMALLCAGAALSLSTAAMSDVVTDWNQQALDSIALTSTNPPRASRALAMMSSAVFDAVNAIDQTHHRYKFNPQVPVPADTSREAAVISASHRVLSALFPTRAAIFNQAKADGLNALPAAGRDAGEALGANIAQQMLDWRSNDGSSASSSYTVTGGPGRWRIDSHNPNAAVVPQWGGMMPFAMNTGSQFRPGPPPALSSPEYAAAVNEVKSIGAVTGSPRTQYQTDTARLWVFGGNTVTPPGSWNQIAQEIASDNAQTVSQNARMFAMLNVAAADAAVVAWDCKYVYDFWRPIHAIREADSAGNSAVVQDPLWLPLISPTPNHPSYTSGHSTFSRSAATALQAFLGTDAVNVDFNGDNGITRNYTSLDLAANEAGLSRIYGGIHFSFDNIEGQNCGLAVGNWVADNYFRVPAPGAMSLLGMVAGVGLRRRR